MKIFSTARVFVWAEKLPDRSFLFAIREERRGQTPEYQAAEDDGRKKRENRHHNKDGTEHDQVYCGNSLHERRIDTLPKQVSVDHPAQKANECKTRTLRRNEIGKCRMKTRTGVDLVGRDQGLYLPLGLVGRFRADKQAERVKYRG